MSRSATPLPENGQSDLPETVPACHDLIRQLLQSQNQLMDRLSVLEEKVNLNSRNSSKPPSSDGPGTPPRPRPKSGKRAGGQPGHKGTHREMLAEDQVHHQVQCPAPLQCEGCGQRVEVDADKAIRHQVFELPRIEPVVTEYVRVRGICCGCGRKHHGALPAGVPSGQLGPRALALVGTLAGQFHLTQRKVQAVLSHIMGIRFSLGTVSQAHGRVSEALAAPVAQLHAELQHAPVCHADETRHQSHGQTLWMWALASDWGVRFRIDPSRGQMAARLLLGDAPRCTRTANTCANLIKIWPALWTFVDNPLVPPTNNAAERALRDYVIKRKLSYGTRSGRGLQFTERIFSTVQTCKMQGRVAFDFIDNALQSWLSGIRAPSLVPEHIHLRHAYG